MSAISRFYTAYLDKEYKYMTHLSVSNETELRSPFHI